ncbi:hypothetical protein [Amycolatopsis sp.]|uniref:hypothetical protein n=1 Tax=Amycolatopsis sp. TaxID=37632 RepID=UPI002E0016B2|nr:hypothetical protein [Amycolatopsis sp.]
MSSGRWPCPAAAPLSWRSGRSTSLQAPDTHLRLSNPGTEPALLTVCTSKGMLGSLNGQTIAPPWAQ